MVSTGRLSSFEPRFAFCLVWAGIWIGWSELLVSGCLRISASLKKSKIVIWFSSDFSEEEPNFCF